MRGLSLCFSALLLLPAFIPAARAQMLTGYADDRTSAYPQAAAPIKTSPPPEWIDPQSGAIHDNGLVWKPRGAVTPPPMASAAPARAPMLTAPAAEPPSFVTAALEPDLPVASPRPQPMLTGSEDATGYAEVFYPSGREPSVMDAGTDAAAPIIPSISDEDEDATQLPVDITADDLRHDDLTNTITASGHVRLVQGKRVLQADEISYNLGNDTGVARGHVLLAEPNGDLHFADEVHLNNSMKTGLVKGLRSYLANGGRFTAVEGERRIGEIVMTDASYTPCECDEKEGGAPGWQVKADKVTYLEDENRVTYKNAHFEVLGVPVIWTPFLAHPDGKVKQKSGFLTPSFGYDSDLGAMIAQNYYWAIAPDRDATLGMMLTTQKNPVALAGYRQRFEDAEIEIEGSATSSSRTDSQNGQDVLRDDEFRGHLFAEGLWDINQLWRAGLDLELTSDDQYLRQYDFSGEDVLENEIYAERFYGRDYAVVRALAFQDVRVRENRVDQPNVLPEAMASFRGEPNALLGGRWSFDMSGLGLQRNGSGQDVYRAVAQAGWERRMVADIGLVSTIDLALRGDAYYVTDRDVVDFDPGRQSSGSESRMFPFAHIVSSYPLARPYERMQAVIEPVGSITLAPSINAEDSNIPNEDSQDVQIDALNVFDADRFPGYDRIEDRSHATYGLRTGLYGYGGSHIEVFGGQSFRLQSDEGLFPDGSGLSERRSDVVGRVSGSYGADYGVDYRFQLNSENFASERHEFEAYANWNRFHYTTRYLFARALEGTDISESREQIANDFAVDVTEHWRVRTGAVNDLGEDPGLRRAVAGIDYLGCCVTLSATAERNLTDDSSGDSGLEIMFRMGLKGMGDSPSSSDGRYRDDNREQLAY